MLITLKNFLHHIQTLQVGFCPFADTKDPKLQPVGVIKCWSGAPNLDDECIAFLWAQRDQGIKLKCYLRAFGLSCQVCWGGDMLLCWHSLLAITCLLSHPGPPLAVVATR